MPGPLRRRGVRRPAAQPEPGDRPRGRRAGPRRRSAALDLRRLGVDAVSVSVGVAVATRADQPIGDLIAEADRALYRAKRGGRDRVVAA